MHPSLSQFISFWLSRPPFLKHSLISYSPLTHPTHTSHSHPTHTSLTPPTPLTHPTHYSPSHPTCASLTPLTHTHSHLSHHILTSLTPHLCLIHSLTPHAYLLLSPLLQPWSWSCCSIPLGQTLCGESCTQPLQSKTEDTPGTELLWI